MCALTLAFRFSIALLLLLESVPVEARVNTRKLQSPTLLDAVGNTETGVFRFLLDTVGQSRLLESLPSATVFVPSDDALSKTPKKWVHAEYKYHLLNLLGLHFTNRVFRSADLTDGLEIMMLNGETVTVSVNTTQSLGRIQLQPSFNTLTTIVKSDVDGSNGVAHFLDNALRPTFLEKNILNVIEGDGELFSAFLAAIQRVNLAEILGHPNAELTLLAPTKAAFDNADVNLDDPVLLEKIIRSHVLVGVHTSELLRPEASIRTLAGLQLTIESDGVTTSFMGGDGTKARLGMTNRPANNGLVHSVDAILLPPTPGTSGVSPSSLAADDSLLDLLANTTFSSAVESAGLSLTLAGSGPFTVFAPSDEAFMILPDKYFTENFKYHLQDILLYHVFSGEVSSELLQSLPETSLSMGNGDSVDVATMSGSTYLTPTLSGTGSGAVLERMDTMASNAILHSISGVLSPFSLREGVLQVAERANLSGFLRILETVNLTSLLADPMGEFTIFVPSNAALTEYDGMDELLSDEETLSTLIKHHILVDGIVPISMIRHGSSLLPLEGGSIFASVGPETGNMLELTGANMNSTAKIVAGNIPANNGILHVIDSVLVPNIPSLMELLRGTTMESLIELANLTDTLDAAGTQTLLVPRSEAFETVPSMWMESPAYVFHLRDLLLFHLVPEMALQQDDFADMPLISMANGEELSVEMENTKVMFKPSISGRSQLSIPGFAASNGIAHSISDVLSPPSLTNDLAAVARQLGLRTLLTAFESANLTDMLEDPEANITLLAPSDAAFAAVKEIDELMDNPTALKEILGFHLLDGVFPSTLLGDDSIPTFVGDDVNVKVMGEDITFFGGIDASVVRANIPAANGIIYLIDTVLLPPLYTMVSETIANTSLGTAFDDAGLTDLLNLEGPITFFRPTEAALTNLPSKFFEPAYTYHLRDILRYHVSSSPFDIGNSTSAMMLEMANGESVSVSIDDDSDVSLTPSLTGSAMLETASQRALNGMVYKVDDVLAPFSVRNPAPNVIEREGLGLFIRAMELSNFTEMLSNRDGTYTILAPSDLAFQSSPDADALFANPSELRHILRYHLFDVMFHTDVLPSKSTITPLSGQPIVVEREGNTTMFTGKNTAQVVNANLPANNAIIHVIDTLLIPPEGATRLPDDTPTRSPTSGSSVPGRDDSDEEDGNRNSGVNRFRPSAAATFIVWLSTAYCML